MGEPGGLFSLKVAKQGHANMATGTPSLQELAIRVLSLTCSALDVKETDWITFDKIHSKKRNRLEHQKSQDLFFQQVVDRKDGRKTRLVRISHTRMGSER